MKRIENAKELIDYLNNWDYGKTYFARNIIENYAAECEIIGNGSSWDNDIDNIPYSYICKLTEGLSYEDTNGLDDLDSDIREEFDSDIEDFCDAILKNESMVNELIKSKERIDVDDLWEKLNKPGEEYIDQILEEIDRLFNN